MNPMMWHWSSIVVPSLLVAQQSQLPADWEALKPRTPERIRVGCGVQKPYQGPAQQWFISVDSLSDDQIADLEKVLVAHSDDMCARGYLIAHGNGHVARRLEHVLWMIENRAEWDGFLLPTSSAGNGDNLGERYQIREAWSKQINADQRSGAVLHNAAVFFEWNEPDKAVALLERAIRLEPEVAFHVEGLGAVYGRSQLSFRDSLFAERARSTLLSSTDPLIIGGALIEMEEEGKGLDTDFGRRLLARLGELAGNRTAMDVLKSLPSRSARYTRYQCEIVRLQRRCVDSLIP
jgi:hypothetical protein